MRIFRKFRNSIPHYWFEPQNPNLGEDAHIKKLSSQITSEEMSETHLNRDHLESNDIEIQLYEVRNSDFEKNPRLMRLYLKLYSHLDPASQLENFRTLPFLKFDSEIQKLVEFSSNYTYSELNQVVEIDTRYIVSRLAPPYFKLLVDEFLARIPVCGMTLPLKSYNIYEELTTVIEKEFYSFFHGEGTFFDEAERVFYKELLCQQMASKKWIDQRKIPYTTELEENFILGMTNWCESEEEGYRYRPYFRDIDIIEEIESEESQNRAFSIYERFINQEKKQAELIGNFIFHRLKKYISSPEFRNSFTLPGSFVARHNILIVHNWLITERLIDISAEIKKNMEEVGFWEKLTSETTRRRLKNSKKVVGMIERICSTLSDFFNEETSKALGRVKINSSQKKKIKNICEKQAKFTSFLMYRLFMQGNEELHPVMSAIFFPEDKERNTHPFVYEFGEYVSKHREYLYSLDLEDIIKCNLDWDVCRMDREKIKSLMGRELTEEVEIDAEHDLDMEEIMIITQLEEELPDVKVPIPKKSKIDQFDNQDRDNF